MASLQDQLLNTVAEMHSMQDGLTIGVLFALSYVFPPAATLLLGLLGVSGFSKKLRLKKLIESADELVRTEEIQKNPEYFVVGFLAGIVLTGIPGVVLGFVTLPVF